MIIIDGKEYLVQVKELIDEYLTYLGRDLTFQNIDEELNDLTKKYCSPNGEILVAIENNNILGMVAYHRLSEKVCEMKRLYVRPHARRKGVGETLVSEIIKHARKSDYQEMVLDTIKPLKEAISLYKKLGFNLCDAYYDNPMDDVIYMYKLLH